MPTEKSLHAERPRYSDVPACQARRMNGTYCVSMPSRSINTCAETVASQIVAKYGCAAAICHLARTLCRRAERRAWAASKITPLNAELLRYLNRLSDLLFVMARCLARQDGGQETLWQR